MLANFSDERIVNQLQILLSSKQFEKIQLVFINFKLAQDEDDVDKWDMNLENLMNYKYAHDPWINEIVNVVKISQQQHKNITLSECEMQNECLYYYDNIIVSNSKSL